MKWFDRMTVFRKLLLAFAVVIGFCVVIGGSSLKTLSSMHDITDAICDQHMNGLYWMEEANRHKIDSDLAAANLGYATDDAGRQKLKDGIVASLKEMHGAYDQYRATIATSKGQEMFDEVLRKSTVWEGIVHQQIGLEPIPAGVDNNELVRRAIASSEALRDRITALIDYRRQQATEAQQEASADYEHMRIVMLALVLGAIAAGTLLATMIARRLARQLGGEPDYAMHIANRIADGDLSVHVDTRAGDTDSMLFALRNMRERLAGIVSGISESSESILMASGEIAQGNTDLSQRTEEQAAALQETASSMQELTSTVKMNAENAQQAGRRGAWRFGGGGARQRSGRRRGRNDARVGGRLEAHDRHHRGDRGDRVSDQHSRAECSGGSGACRRTGTRLCGGGGGSAFTGPAQRGVGQGDQGADRELDGARGQRR